MKKLIAIAAFVALTGVAFGQKYKTTTGSISFHSKATLEDIEAKNNQVTSLLDASNGNLAFIVIVKSFEFDKSLMQTHFNDNYMQSDTYPKSTFDGKITNNSDVKYGTNGTYEVTVSGKLTMHGVTKEVTAGGSVVVSGTNVTLKSSFKVKLEDYGIKNDKVKNIASDIEVNVNTTLVKQ
jgi:YceI-like domain